jgi:hypothetical protein
MQGDTQLRSYNITLEARAAAPAVPHIGTQQAVSSRAAQEVTVFPSQRTADKYKAVPQRTQHEIFITPGMGKYKEEKHDSYTIISKYSPAFQQPSQYNQGIRVSQYSTLGSFSRVQHSISPQRSIIQQRSILEQRSILQYSIVPQYSMRHSLTPGNLAFRQYTPVFQHNGLGYGTEQYSLRRAGITAMCCPVRSKATLSVVQNPQGFLSFAATHA